MVGAPDGFAADEDGLDDRPFADINVTPLVDVMLVLLVVFMMAAPLLVQGVPLDLPKGAGHAIGKPQRPIILSLTRDGSITLRDETIAQPALAARLRQLREAEGDSIVYVRADQRVLYGDVMALVSTVDGSGFSHVSLMNQPKRAAP